MEATQESTPLPGELDALWKQFEECPPLLTPEEMEETSRMLFAADGVRTVRAGLVMLTKSGRELLDVLHGDPEMAGAFGELAECIKDRADRLRGVAEALETAEMRLQLVLCDAGTDGGAKEPLPSAGAA